MARKGGLVRYTMEFNKTSGCPRHAVMGMAKHDGATVISMHGDDHCEGDNIRRVTMEGRYAPSMGRWLSLEVGAREL